MAETKKKEIELCKFVCPPGVIAIVLLALGIWLIFVNLIVAIILLCLIPVEILFFIWMYRRSTRPTP
ncbi:MAG: hypothetical protein ACFE8M_05720 [Candidatus Hermodarchaeota archaeon]